MNYTGGKFRQGKTIAATILPFLKDGATYIEPFCGAMGVAIRVVEAIEDAKISDVTIKLSDSHQPLITMWQALLSGWEPPLVVTQAMHVELKKEQDPLDPLTAYVGFGMSFRGRYFASYSHDMVDLINLAGPKRSATLFRSVMYKLDVLKMAQHLSVDCLHYQTYENVKGAVFYLDPPYNSRVKVFGGFNHDDFWGFARRLSENNDVLITEFNAPDDFVAVYSFGNTAAHSFVHPSPNLKSTVNADERIFMHRSKV